MPGPVPAQQKKPAIPVQRTFVPDEPLVCTAFNGMAARLDAVYKTEEISKSEFDEGMKKYRDGMHEEGEDVVIKALLESEAARRTEVDRYNKLVESVNAYNKAVNDLVVTVNTSMNEPKGSKLAPMLSFNFVRLQPIICTRSPFPFTNSTAYMASTDTMANATPTIHCE